MSGTDYQRKFNVAGEGPYLEGTDSDNSVLTRNWTKTYEKLNQKGRFAARLTLIHV